MNKKLLAVAVGSTLMFGAAASAVASPTVYGRAIAYLQNCSACTTTSAQEEETWNMEFGGSRLGVKGDEDLGGGLKAIYTIEFGVALDGTTNSLKIDEGGVIDLNNDGDMTDTDVEVKGESQFDPGNRPKWVGLAGSFGQVKLGRQFHPLWDYVAASTDIFTEGTIRNQFGARASDMVYYNSPKIGGIFDFGVAAIFGGGRDDEQLDETQVGARVVVGPVTVSAAAATVKSSNGTQLTDTQADDKMGAAVVYKTGPFMAQAAYEVQEENKSGGETIEQEAMILGGSFTAGSHVFLAQYAQQERDNSVPEPTTLKLEYQNHLSKTTRAWVAAISNDSDVTTTDDETQFQLGLRKDF